MRYEELYDLLKKESATRNFKSKEVEIEKLNKVLEAGRVAPSGANTQPWEIIVIKEKERKKEIAEIILGSQKDASEFDEFPYEEKEKVLSRYTKPFYLLVVCGDLRMKNYFPEKGFRDELLATSVYGLIYFMKIAAESLDLGMCWGTTNEYSRSRLSDYFGFPDYLRIYEVLQLGYPSDNSKTSFRKDLSDFVHFKSFNDDYRDIREVSGDRDYFDIYK